ncbi:MAG: tRNA methyltransferase [Pelagibacteraceae bacterium TMED287]|nr:MAG: tRNA methyltransferase [Pelagibacteraceae bacterium TMED287]|tara:strand:- start:574 stop:1023 length:450 start_codon:yes stop_codon:yes gene_type:complete
MINIALYKPDIPQNTAAIVRLAGCLNLKIHIIEPCGFNLDDPRFKRVAMDYIKISKIVRYKDFKSFVKKNSKSRIILMTTKAKKFHHIFKFKKKDILLFGRESSGVPNEIHHKIKNKIKIKMSIKARSLNIAMAVAIASSEALRQNNSL